MSLRGRFDRRLEKLDLPRGPALVAVSGGPDSLALLDLLAGAPSASPLALHVAHVDHGIHPDSARVMETVRRIAAAYRFPFQGESLGLGPGASETVARRARYQWLERKADELGADLIFAAHHRDDQIETVLMRVLNGSGLAGIAGMAVRQGRLVRPLLGFPRQVLAAHAESRGLEVWHDPANLDFRHQRSWIRMELLPMLRRRYPDIERRLLRLARHARDYREALDGMLETQRDLDLRSECDGVSVAASPFSNYDSAVVLALLGALGRRAGCHVGPMRAARIERLLAGGRSGAIAQLGNGCAAELAFGRLRLFREAESPVDLAGWDPIRIEGGTGANRAGRFQLSWKTEPAPERIERNSVASWFSPGPYLVRPWRPADRIRPLRGAGRRLVVRCMQDARIARHLRANWPVVETGGTVVWVPGVCRSAEFLPESGQAAIRIDAYHR